MTVTYANPRRIDTLRRQLMNESQKREIGERLRDLRDNSSETNRSIADYCGVDTRTVGHWMAGDGIRYGNAEKVAELFNVSIDFIWRGKEKGPTPDPFAPPPSSAPPDLEQRLAAVDQKLDRVLALVAELALDIARRER